MKRTTIALLLAIVLLATLVIACGPGGEWGDWQGDVLERQREGLPTDEPTPEVSQ